MSALPQEGLTLDQVREILHYPGLRDLERSFFRALYETWARPNEMVQANIEDYDRKSGVIVLRETKRKWNPRTRQHVQEQPKRPCVSGTTRALLSSVIDTRKKGPVWTNQAGERISLAYLARVLDQVARKLGLQGEIGRIQDERVGTRTYHRISLKSFREAGERHHDLGGGDSELSAKAAQHTMKIKEAHYKRTVWEEVNESQRKNHPAFNGKV